MNSMKRRCFSLLCAVSLLCAISLLSLPLSVRAASKEGQTASDLLLSLDVLSVETAGILDQELIGKNLDKPASQLTGAALLIRLSGADTASAQRAPGVPDDMARDVGYAISKGWIDAGKFNANSPLDANDFFASLLRFLGFKNFDENNAALFARRIGLVSHEYKGNLTGGDLALIAKSALRFPFQDGTGTPAAKLVLLGKCNPGAFSVLGISGRDWSVKETADWRMAAVFGLDMESSDPKDEDGVQASGFFVSPDGIAATCFHAIQGTTKGTATLITGEKFDVQSVLWSDEKMDLALIRISKTSTEGKSAPSFAYLEIGKSDDVQAGEMSYAMGYPLGVGLSISQGLISATGVKLERYGLPCLVSAASISYGSGGGALLNTAGKVIGVTAGAFKYGNEMYLSIPADALANALKNAGGGSPLSSLPAPEEQPGKEVEVEGECEAELQSKSDSEKSDGEKSDGGSKYAVKGTFTVKEESPDLKAVVDY